VRGDRTLTWADISRDGKIECGQALADGACDDAHRAGNDPGLENSRDLSLAPEPFAIDVSPDGRVAMVTHQTTGAVSVFSNCWSVGDATTGDPSVNLRNCANPDVLGPSLQFTVNGLPQRPVGVAALAPPALIAAQGDFYYPGFLVSFRNAPEIDLLRYYPDNPLTTEGSAGAREIRPYASLVSRAGIGVNSAGSDSRGIAIDSSARDQADAKCARDSGIGLDCATSKACVDGLDPDANKALLDCFKSAAATSLDVYVANRTPSTLLLGRTMPAWNALQSTESPVFYDSIPLTQGPSRVVVGDVIVGDANGNPVPERRIFLAAFDSRRIFVYDPIQRRVDVEIATGRGPHALAIDSANGWLYVGHFTDSFIGVVSLDRRFFRTYGKMLATIGKPVAPRASK
jgi:DNA-binding beta-propeller fold protein YncE